MNRSFYLCKVFQKQAKMKRTIFLFLSLCLVMLTKAQEVSDSVTLGEVTVEGAGVMTTVDGLRY